MHKRVFCHFLVFPLITTTCRTFFVDLCTKNSIFYGEKIYYDSKINRRVEIGPNSPADKEQRTSTALVTVTGAAVV